MSLGLNDSFLFLTLALACKILADATCTVASGIAKFQVKPLFALHLLQTWFAGICVSAIGLSYKSIIHPHEHSHCQYLQLSA